MGVLRWLVGISSALALVFFVFILIVGKGLRSAYQSGAGAAHILRDTATFAIPFLLAAMLASAFVPRARGFLHAVAIGVTAAIAGCVVIMLKNPGEGAIYLCFFGLWMLYYATVISSS